jgi:hypothetical protein
MIGLALWLVSACIVGFFGLCALCLLLAALGWLIGGLSTCERGRLRPWRARNS